VKIIIGKHGIISLYFSEIIQKFPKIISGISLYLTDMSPFISAQSQLLGRKNAARKLASILIELPERRAEPGLPTGQRRACRQDRTGF
jgi:hypothetical protein